MNLEPEYFENLNITKKKRSTGLGRCHSRTAGDCSARELGAGSIEACAAVEDDSKPGVYSSCKERDCFLVRPVWLSRRAGSGDESRSDQMKDP